MAHGDDVLVRLREIIDDVKDRSLNEADTRHRVIDFVLHDILAWPRNRTAVEEYVAPGYADFVLKRADGDPLILVEAKRDGSYFNLPNPVNQSETSGYISIKKLLTDNNIKSAMQQVRFYCQDLGCEFAAITNGHEWIFFKTFERGKKMGNVASLCSAKRVFL